MFCSGECKKKNRRCGLFKELIVEKNGVPETIEKCVFEAMLDSLWRQERAGIRIQAAIEHSRNQKADDDLEIKKAVAHGFVGLIHTFQQNPEAIRNAGISKLHLIELIRATEGKQHHLAEERAEIESVNVSPPNEGRP